MKPWYKSKTVWVGALQLVVGVAGVLAGSELVQAYPRLASTVGIVFGTAGVLLRFITEGSIGASASNPADRG